MRHRTLSFDAATNTSGVRNTLWVLTRGVNWHQLVHGAQADIKHCFMVLVPRVGLLPHHGKLFTGIEVEHRIRDTIGHVLWRSAAGFLKLAMINFGA